MRISATLQPALHPYTTPSFFCSPTGSLDAVYLVAKQGRGRGKLLLREYYSSSDPTKIDP